MIETKPTLTSSCSGSQRTFLDTYTSDEIGNKISEDSNYITIEMYVSPTSDGEGAAFIYSGYNN